MLYQPVTGNFINWTLMNTRIFVTIVTRASLFNIIIWIEIFKYDCTCIYLLSQQFFYTNISVSAWVVSAILVPNHKQWEKDVS